MTINEVQDEIAQDFIDMGDEFNRYTLLIELSKALPQIPGQYKTDEYLVEGCQSRVWLHITLEENKLKIDAYSDTLIIRGILELLEEVFSDRSPGEVADAEFYLFERAGIAEFLSAERSKGIGQVIESIRSAARSYLGQT